MPSNRRRHANAIPLASFAMWGFIALFTLGSALAYVWCKNQLYTMGTEIKGLERESAELKNKNEVALSKIAQLSSPAKLQERYDAGFIKGLVPITNDRIVVPTSRITPLLADELRAVTNERSGQ